MQVPGWKRSKEFLSSHPAIKISYGEDGTGNIMHPANIKHFVNTVGSAHIITADGGFDFSENFNAQEMMAAPLIAASLLIALQIQAPGGIFICKMFDTMTRLNHDLLYILCHIYERVGIMKPRTSRPANSERYIICCGFRSVDSPDVFSMLMTLMNYDGSTGRNIRTVLPRVHFPAGYLKQMEIMNTSINNIQLNAIIDTLNYIKCGITADNLQYQLAQEWCQKFKEPMSSSIVI